MQIMEGDVIAHDPARTRSTSRHYHTGGVPGRHEIDETQELNYPAIMKAIVETGYKGYVAPGIHSGATRCPRFVEAGGADLQRVIRNAAAADACPRCESRFSPG